MLRYPKSTVAPRKVYPFEVLAPVNGIDAVSPRLAKPPRTATTLNNWTCFPDRIETRKGSSAWITSNIGATVQRLHQYSSVAGVESLWATTSGGVYDVTTTGGAPGASIALTNGITSGAVLSTGAQNYLILVNGADSMVIYDGATWAATATVGGGAINTNTFSYVEVYRQRVFFAVENTTRLVYLNANTPTGGGTNYDLAAVFRRGGYIAAIGTWTIDGGTGPDDHLVVITSLGEAAVFVGNDPATWTYRGTYYISRPVGTKPLLKFGGDLLYLCEGGVYPLSRALLVATINKSSAVSLRINPLLTALAEANFSSHGWEMYIDPSIPCLVVNTPASSPNQYVMNTQNGGWSTWSGWAATCFGRLGANTYFGSGQRVYKVTAGVADTTGNIAASARTAETLLGKFGVTKKVDMIRPIISVPGNAFAVSTPGTLYVNPDFTTPLTGTPISNNFIGGGGANVLLNKWLSCRDVFSTWKSFGVDITVSGASTSLYGIEMTLITGSPYQRNEFVQT